MYSFSALVLKASPTPIEIASAIILLKPRIKIVSTPRPPPVAPETTANVLYQKQYSIQNICKHTKMLANTYSEHTVSHACLVFDDSRNNAVESPKNDRFYICASLFVDFLRTNLLGSKWGNISPKLITVHVTTYRRIFIIWSGRMCRTWRICYRMCRTRRRWSNTRIVVASRMCRTWRICYRMCRTRRRWNNTRMVVASIFIRTPCTSRMHSSVRCQLTQTTYV